MGENAHINWNIQSLLQAYRFRMTPYTILHPPISQCPTLTPTPQSYLFYILTKRSGKNQH